MRTFIDFLQYLKRHRIPYELSHIKDNYITVSINLSGESWEIDFSADNDVVVERFGDIGTVVSTEILEFLFDNFSI